MRRAETEPARRAVKEQEGDVSRFRSHDQYREKHLEEHRPQRPCLRTDLILLDRTLRGYGDDATAARAVLAA
jgi:hypothetical protein